MKSNFQILLFSAIGMFLGYLLASGNRVQTARLNPTPHPLTPADSQKMTVDTLRVRRFEFLDESGRVSIQMAISSEGTPAIWFFDKNGKAKLSMGLYGDGNSFVVLNDDQQSAVGIFRTVGSSIAPVLVMKSKGQDRMVQGLNWNQSDPEPFLVRYDSKGLKTHLFGNF